MAAGNTPRPSVLLQEDSWPTAKRTISPEQRALIEQLVGYGLIDDYKQQKLLRADPDYLNEAGIAKSVQAWLRAVNPDSLATLAQAILTETG